MAEEIQRCAIYIRVSTSEQMIHGKSLESQKSYLVSYAKSHKMDVAGIYADEGRTARKERKKRKAIHALLEDVRTGRIDVILFWRLDRWFRNMSDFYRVQDVLDAYGVRWISASEPGINMETRDGRLQLNVVLSIGQNEVDTTSERIRFVNEASIRQGKAIFGEANMPPGYKLGIINGKKCMVKDPEEEEMVRAFFDHFEKHQSKQETLRYMQTYYDPSFSYGTLRTMLSSEFYKGTYRGIPYCPPYLAEERWLRLQSVSQRNIKYSPSGRIYYFSGLIRCPLCGRLLTGTGSKAVINRKTGETRDYCYYRCNRAVTDRACKNVRRLSQNLLEARLLEDLGQQLQQYRIRPIHIANLPRREPQKRTSQQIGKELDRLNLLFQKGRISWDYYNTQYRSLEEEKKLSLEADAKKAPDLSYLVPLLEQDFKTIYDYLSPENKRSFWRNTVRQIHLKEDGTVDFAEYL